MVAYGILILLALMGFAIVRELATQLGRMGVRIFEQSPVTETGNEYIKSGEHTLLQKLFICADQFFT